MIINIECYASRQAGMNDPRLRGFNPNSGDKTSALERVTDALTPTTYGEFREVLFKFICHVMLCLCVHLSCGDPMFGNKNRFG